MEAVKGVFPWMSFGGNTIINQSFVQSVIVLAIAVECDNLEQSPNKVDPNFSFQFRNFSPATLG